jgi:hypothetical protein
MTVVRKLDMGHKQFTLRAAVIVGIAAAIVPVGFVGMFMVIAAKAREAGKQKMALAQKK